MDLRAPIPQEHRSSYDRSSDEGDRCNKSSKSTTETSVSTPTSSSFDDTYETIVDHLVCRMYISSLVMELGSESRFTGLVLFHRYVRHFYGLMEQQRQKPQPQKQLDQTDDQQQSNEEWKQIKNHLGQVASACLFLGCKMEEESRRIRDVINVSAVLDFSGWNDSMTQQTTKPITITESKHPPPLDESYWTAKENMVSTEQQVLRMLQFDALVCHPHRCVVIVMDTLGFGTGVDKSSANDGRGESTTSNNSLLTPEQSERVICGAWRILNDSSLDARGRALVYPVIVLSCAAISLAASGLGVHPDSKTIGERNSEDTSTLKKIELPGFWWRALDVSTDEMNSTKSTLCYILQQQPYP